MPGIARRLHRRRDSQSPMAEVLPQFEFPVPGHRAAESGALTIFGCCVGFRMPAQLQFYQRALRAGVRKPPGKEPAVDGVVVAVYGDLTGGGPARAMRGSAKPPAADRLRRSERGRSGFREGGFGATGGMARVFIGHVATGLRHRKRCLPAGGRSNEMTTVVMVSRSWRRVHPAAGRAVRRCARRFRR